MPQIERNIYLERLPIAEAVAKAKQNLDREFLVKTVSIPSHEAAGRISAAPVHARFSSPTFHSAAMDGIAVKAASTYSAREGRPLKLSKNVDYVDVNTGNPLPSEPVAVDAVIMIEDVTRIDEDTVAVEKPAFPWQHVRRIGEDIVATELLFPRRHRFTAHDVGALLAAGVWEVTVYEQIKIAIMPTGDEVLDFTSRPDPGKGQVVESNSQVLAALAREAGCEVTRVPPVPDKLDELSSTMEILLNSEAHVVVVCAGSSAGSKDFTRSIIEKHGQVLVHGIQAMPGKPSLLGAAKGKLVVGAPGYPVSAVVCFEELVKPLLAWLGRDQERKPLQVDAMLTRRSPSKLGLEEFLRLSVGKVGDKYVATPLSRGAGNITSLSRAQAVTRIPADKEGVEQGEFVRAELLVEEKSLESTLVAVGSHDNTLDLLKDALMVLDEPIRLTSGHVGSLGGLMALKQGAAHMAGTHLFDPVTADYNFPFLDKYLPGMDLLLVNLAVRHQGLIVAKGNPKGIKGVQDLARSEVAFINRQRGAGTRILLDHHLEQAGIKSSDVQGYQKEEFTHMAVAVNVLTGAADCGLGIYAAAKALDLDFVPLARERYDLAIPIEHKDDPRIKAVLALLQDTAFQERIQALGGYEIGLTGQVMEPGLGLGE